MQPLQGVRVLDFSTLLPGPLASLLLAEAGAEVIKVERPGHGDELRHYEPHFVGSSAFALLNRGKRSIAVDLKESKSRERIERLVRDTDVLIEQFRPGVMDRLGLGYDKLKGLNPRLIYCSISGYGAEGPKSQTAGHDLTYAAESGLLSLTAGADGAPVLPAALLADIGGGTFPALSNILLALLQRARTGEGCHLEVAMYDNLFMYMYWALANAWAGGRWPKPGGELITGGSPRYQIYRTADDRYIAAAPLEERFWQNFCVVLGLPPELADDSRDARATRKAVAERIRGRRAAEWEAAFAGKDVCCAVVKTLQEAVEDPHFRSRGLLARRIASPGLEMPALPVPIDPLFRGEHLADGFPSLGEGNVQLFGE
jgi:crotonobetainyl-CoA:carnitine CoA-transferase CaiB-like acyl-CoA transferase